MPSPRSEREFAVEVVRTLRDAGFEALWAGGCVRDELLGLVPKDYDVASSALPEQVQKLFRRTVAVGASFGVIEILGPRVDGAHLRVQVATFRTDGPYVGGRWPEFVVFASAEEDAKRRDFTVNGMFHDPLEDKIIDYVGGRSDLEARMLRAIGDPYERLKEDRLRMLRAARVAARFDFAIDPATASAITKMAPQLGEGVSAERIADELRKMLVDRSRANAMRLFMDLGLAAVVMPELVPMRGFPQGLPSPDGPGLPPPGQAGQIVVAEGRSPDLWEHSLRVLELLPEKVSFPLAAAALFHDVGKPRTVGRTADRYTFHAHEHVGKRVSGEICGRLKLSNEESDRIGWLVEKHQILADAPRMRPAKLKVLLVHPGIFELFALHRADAQASERGVEHIEYAEKMRQEWMQKGELNPPPPITGEDLIAMGLKQGPLFKILLDLVREAQLDGAIRSREQALELVRREAEARADFGPG